MLDAQEIIQSRFGYTNRFHFGEDQLKVTSQDASGESTRSLNYEFINLDANAKTKINAGKRYYVLILVVATVATMTIQTMFPGRLDFAWAAASISVAIYCVLRYLNPFTVTFTLLRPTSGAGTPIRITHDKHYDDVLQRIKSGRIARLRKLHLAVDFENAPKQEERKFKWLLDQGVISEAEYQGAIARLSVHPSGLPDDSRTAVHLQ
jgi:hypothetical protein